MRSGDILRRVRRICRALPDTDEGSPFGHPWFRVNCKLFVSFADHENKPCIVVKVGKDLMGVFLEDPRFFRAPYIGQHGWVGLRLAGSIDWEEVEELIRGSYAKVATPSSRQPRARRKGSTRAPLQSARR